MTANVPSLTHKNRHAAGGPDAISPADIGAQPAGNYVPGNVPTDGRALVPTTLAAKKLWVGGHSFTLEPGLMCTAGQEWVNQLIARASMTAGRIGYALSGGRPPQIAYAALGVAGSAAAIVAGAQGLGVLEASGGDYRFAANPPTAVDLNSTMNANRAMVAALSAGSINQVTAAWSAGDTTLYNANFWGNGTLHYSLSVASPVLTVPVDWTRCLGGVAYLLHLIELGNTRTMTVNLDGTTIATYDKTNQGGSAGVSAKGVIKLTGLPTSGTHTLTVTGSTTGTNAVSIEAVMYPAAAPIPVIVTKDPFFRTSDQAVELSNKPYFDAGIDALCAEFPNAIPCDLGRGGWWDADLHLGSDLNHPNDKGMTAITNRLAQVLVARGL